MFRWLPMCPHHSYTFPHAQRSSSRERNRPNAWVLGPHPSPPWSRLRASCCEPVLHDTLLGALPLRPFLKREKSNCGPRASERESVTTGAKRQPDPVVLRERR